MKIENFQNRRSHIKHALAQANTPVFAREEAGFFKGYLLEIYPKIIDSFKM